MEGLTRYQVPSVVLAGAGVLLVLLAFQVTPHPFQPEYGHSVERVAESEVPDEADVLAFADLSANAKDAFRAAVRSPDGHATVYGAGNEPREFFYSDHASLGQGLYYVEYQGAYYELYTFAGGGLGHLAELFFLALASGGVLALAIGGASLRRERPRLPLTALVALVAVGAWIQFRLYAVVPDTRAVIALGLLVILGPAVATWLVLDRLWAGVSPREGDPTG